MSIFSSLLVGRNMYVCSSIHCSLIQMPETVQSSVLRKSQLLLSDYEEDLHIDIYTVDI